MVTDSETEQSAEAIRSEKAAKAYLGLIHEIGELDQSEITEQTAPFIAGLLVARHLEDHLLDTDDILSYGNPGSLLHRKRGRENRMLTSDHFRILDEARKGNFSKLKGFVEKASDSWREDAQDYEEGDPENLLLSQIATNLGLISQRIPLAGNGLVIKVPNPAHMEDHIPLRIQLERFAKGEAIR